MLGVYEIIGMKLIDTEKRKLSKIIKNGKRSKGMNKNRWKEGNHFGQNQRNI